MDEQVLISLGPDPTVFPDPVQAFSQPNGLLAIGGDLSPARLLAAYQQGIFPWFDQEPLLWWSPDPRTVLFLKDFKVSKSLKKALRHSPLTIRADENFAQVIKQCAAPRHYRTHTETGTWLTPAMQDAYQQLFALGYAHSIEVYRQNILVGGLYGVSIGRNFSAESMFSQESEASKIALFFLVNQLLRWEFEFIDCQVWSPHLGSLGASLLPRSQFIAKVKENNQFDTRPGKWTLDKNLWPGSLSHE